MTAYQFWYSDSAHHLARRLVTDCVCLQEARTQFLRGSHGRELEGKECAFASVSLLTVPNSSAAAGRGSEGCRGKKSYSLAAAFLRMSTSVYTSWENRRSLPLIVFPDSSVSVEIQALERIFTVILNILEWKLLHIEIRALARV